MVHATRLLSRVESIVSCSNILRIINTFNTKQHVKRLGDVIRKALHYKLNADAHT